MQFLGFETSTIDKLLQHFSTKRAAAYFFILAKQSSNTFTALPTMDQISVLWPQPREAALLQS
jgi:hypothetical protein